MQTFSLFSHVVPELLITVWQILLIWCTVLRVQQPEPSGLLFRTLPFHNQPWWIQKGKAWFSWWRRDLITSQRKGDVFLLFLFVFLLSLPWFTIENWFDSNKLFLAYLFIALSHIAARMCIFKTYLPLTWYFTFVSLSGSHTERRNKMYIWFLFFSFFIHWQMHFAELEGVMCN